MLSRRAWLMAGVSLLIGGGILTTLSALDGTLPRPSQYMAVAVHAANVLVIGASVRAARRVRQFVAFYLVAVLTYVLTLGDAVQLLDGIMVIFAGVLASALIWIDQTRPTSSGWLHLPTGQDVPARLLSCRSRCDGMSRWRRHWHVVAAHGVVEIVGDGEPVITSPETSPMILVTFVNSAGVRFVPTARPMSEEHKA